MSLYAYHRNTNPKLKTVKISLLTMMLFPLIPIPSIVGNELFESDLKIKRILTAVFLSDIFHAADFKPIGYPINRL